MNYTYVSNEGPTLFLHRYGTMLPFTSPTSCTALLQAIKGGRATMVEAIMKDNIFVDVAPGDADLATAIVDNYFGQQSAFYMIGSADDFVATEHGGTTLEEVFPELFEYVSLVIGFGKSL